MKTHLIAAAIVLLVVALPPALYAQETDPAAVVAGLYDAFNARDVDAFLALCADDAAFTITPPPPGVPGESITYTGPEEIRAWQERQIAANGQIEYEILQVEGDTVTVRSRYSDDQVRALGIESIEEADEFVVQGGKVTFGTFTVTEESLAELQAAMAALELPETGVGPPPTETLPSWVGVGGLLLLALGLSLGLQRAFSRAR